ncbi:MAG TPA: trigger factor [Candidatus Paceibacterota bacterium]
MNKINKLEKSKVEIISSIEAKHFESFRKKALENINNEITIDGFRKGKVPENILITKVGEMNILEEMAELAISEAYPKILVEEKIDAIGRPEINITKIAKDNPLEFKVITAVIPEVKLADYKKIAKEEKGNNSNEKIEEATEKEIDDAKWKKRIILSDKLIESSSMDIPEVLIESEVKRIEAQFGDDVARMGVKIEDYLSHAKKTIEDLRKDWKPHAEKKAKLQLILNEISKLEKIKLDEKELEKEINHILEHYKDADREQVRVYAETVLMNEQVFRFLEN